jgi:putative oxidoreductase
MPNPNNTATSSTTSAAQVAQTLFRIALGSTLVAHGSQKLFGWFGGSGLEATATAMNAMGFRPAKAHAVLSGVGEAGAGAALALGAFTSAAGSGAAITMSVAAAVHAPNGFFGTKGGLEFPAILALAATAYTLGGPGPLSTDALTGGRLDKPWMRAAALSSIPIIVGVELYRRKRALKSDLPSKVDTKDKNAETAGTPDRS